MTKALDFDTEIALNKYMDHIRGNYCGWNTKETAIASDMRESFIKSVRYEVGNKYIKVISGSGVHSFIVLKAGKFSVGSVLKAASWAAPATNFVRANIFDGNFMNISWTGAH